jgi:hypothetical protein
MRSGLMWAKEGRSKYLEHVLGGVRFIGGDVELEDALYLVSK